MFEVQLFVPLFDNNNVPFVVADFEAFEAEACTLFGGVTRLPNNAVGAWLDKDNIYHDKHAMYVVLCGSITDGAKVATLVAYVRDAFRQKAVYVRYLGLAEVL